MRAFDFHARRAFALAFAAMGLLGSSAGAAVIMIPTNQGAPDPFGANQNTTNAFDQLGNGGADAEIREGSSVNDAANATGSHTVNREPDGIGTNSTEFATRHAGTGNPPVAPYSNQSRQMLRFDISGLTPAIIAANPVTTVRMHINSTSWNNARSFLDPTQFGLNYYGLNVGAAGQNWVENTVTWVTAPGILTEDTDPGTAGLQRSNDTADWDPSNTTSLGFLPFSPPDPANHLAVGSAWDFSSPALSNLVAAAVAAGQQTVTLYVQADPAASGFNYIFAQKDTPSLLVDGAWDPDGSGEALSGPSPYSGASNANGEFSPKLFISDSAIEPFPVPEPSGLAIVGLAAGAALRRARRRR